MQRELSYRLPFARLAKLSRTASRKGYPLVWWLTWLWIGVFLAVMIAISLFADDIRDAFDPLDLGPYVLLVAVALAFMAGMFALRRLRIAKVQKRATFNETIKLTQDEGGLRFATDEVEHYLKWRGISQLLLEPDGVVVSHGNLFFLIPNQAFASTDDRAAFIRDV
jgi:O-antigen ligase